MCYQKLPRKMEQNNAKLKGEFIEEYYFDFREPPSMMVRESFE